MSSRDFLVSSVFSITKCLNLWFFFVSDGWRAWRTFQRFSGHFDIRTSQTTRIAGLDRLQNHHGSCERRHCQLSSPDEAKNVGVSHPRPDSVLYCGLRSAGWETTFEASIWGTPQTTERSLRVGLSLLRRVSNHFLGKQIYRWLQIKYWKLRRVDIDDVQCDKSDAFFSTT